MASYGSPASAGRRIGLSRSQAPAPLHKNIRGREMKSPLPIKPSKNKQPDAIDGPPVSSDDEDGVEPALSSRPGKTARHGPRTSLKLPDSSDDSDYGRAASASIKPTKFVSTSQADGHRPRDTEPYRGTSRPGAWAGNKRRRQDDDDIKGVEAVSSSLDKKYTTSEPSSSAAHMEDGYGFIRKGKSKKGNTYSSQRARQTKVSRDVASSKPKIQVPDDLKSPEKTKKSLRIPGNSGISPLKEPAAKLRTDLHSEDDVLTSPVPKATSKRIKPSESSPRSDLKAARAKQKLARELQARKSLSPPRAKFKMPEDLPNPNRDRSHADGMVHIPLSDFDSSGDEAVVQVPNKEEEKAHVAVCPWCGDIVDETSLKDFSRGKRMNVRMQTKFCQKHKKLTAMESWQAKGYPEVEWDDLKSRFANHDELLLGIVNGEPSYFRSILADKIESGKARSLKKEDNMNPGYYGPRGFNLMCDYLVDKFADLLKKRAVDDRVIAGRGSAAFIQSVLVAELAVQLIVVDMDVPEEEARDIMEESKVLGEMVHEEL